MVETEHIGGYCPHCGTHHRVIESIPARPLRTNEVRSINQSDDIVLCREIMAMSGEMAGMSTGEEVTEDIVLADETAARVLTFYRDYGWVVEIEEEYAEGESPEEVAEEVYQDAASMSSEAMEMAFNGR